MKSRSAAFDDALCATKAAVAEGVVPGAGLALLRVTDTVTQLEAKLDGGEATGAHPA